MLQNQHTVVALVVHRCQSAPVHHACAVSRPEITLPTSQVAGTQLPKHFSFSTLPKNSASAVMSWGIRPKQCSQNYATRGWLRWRGQHCNITKDKKQEKKYHGCVRRHTHSGCAASLALCVCGRTVYLAFVGLHLVRTRTRLSGCCCRIATCITK